MLLSDHNLALAREDRQKAVFNISLYPTRKEGEEPRKLLRDTKAMLASVKEAVPTFSPTCAERLEIKFSRHQISPFNYKPSRGFLLELRLGATQKPKTKIQSEKNTLWDEGKRDDMEQELLQQFSCKKTQPSFPSSLV